MKWNNLSTRERVLAIVVGASIFLLLNLLLLNVLLKRHARAREDIATARVELDALKELGAERDRWATRSEWLTTRQPKLENESTAGVELLAQVKSQANAAGIPTLEKQDFVPMERTPTHQAVTITLETRSSWAALISFLHGLQHPEQFIVLDSVEIEVDSADPTLMRGRYRISKWYAPRN